MVSPRWRMIAAMNGNPEHPAAEQAFTTFQLPARPRQLALIVAACVVVLLALSEASTAAGVFTAGSPGPMRTAVVISVGYLAIRGVLAGLSHWHRRGLGPDIERIDS